MNFARTLQCSSYTYIYLTLEKERYGHKLTCLRWICSTKTSFKLIERNFMQKKPIYLPRSFVMTSVWDWERCNQWRIDCWRWVSSLLIIPRQRRKRRRIFPLMKSKTRETNQKSLYSNVVMVVDFELELLWIHQQCCSHFCHSHPVHLKNWVKPAMKIKYG